MKKNVYEVEALLTTVTAGYERISMHGVREKLLEKQAESLNIPLEKVYISANADNNEYERNMEKKLSEYKSKGVKSVVFGDIFLEDLKVYRESRLSEIDMKGIFPIWKRDTKKIARHFIEKGFKAITVCVDSKVLDENFVGRNYDEEFLNELPEGVDWCGENGEFHTFVYDGPIFSQKINFKKGEIVFRENRFYFCDLLC